MGGKLSLENLMNL